MSEARSKLERLLIITSSYPRSGDDSAGHFVRAEVEALRAAGHTVTVAAGGQSAGDLQGVHFLGARDLFDAPGALPRLKAQPWRLLSLTAATRELRRLEASLAERFDRVIAHWLVPGAYPWALSLNDRSVPIEVVFHGSDLRLLLAAPMFVRVRLLRRLRDRGAELRFVSQDLRNLLERAPMPVDLWSFVAKSRVEPSPIECGPDVSREEARRRLGLKRETRWGVVVARLIPEKRVKVALRAAELVPDLQVAVIGDGPLAGELRERFPAVRFVGQLPHKEALLWIRAADLLLATSRNEGAPTVIREARTVGTPVVSAPSGDTRLWARKDRGLWLIR